MTSSFSYFFAVFAKNASFFRFKSLKLTLFFVYKLAHEDAVEIHKYFCNDDIAFFNSNSAAPG